MCGEGGSGLVYLVKLKNTSMYFALKVSESSRYRSRLNCVRLARGSLELRRRVGCVVVLRIVLLCDSVSLMGDELPTFW